MKYELAKTTTYIPAPLIKPLPETIKIVDLINQQDLRIQALTQKLEQEQNIAECLIIAIKMGMDAQQQKAFPGLREAVIRWEKNALTRWTGNKQ